MKTFVLSADDMQQFTKLIYEQQKSAAANKAAVAAAQAQMAQSQHPLVVNSSISSSNGNVLHATTAYASSQLTNGLNSQTQAQHQQQQQHQLPLQYYLKQPTTVVATVTAPVSSIAPTASLMVTSNINGNNVNYPTTVIQQSHHQQQEQQQYNNQIQQQINQQQQQQLHHNNTTTTHLLQQQIPNINPLRIKQPNGQTSKVQHQHQIANGYQHAHQHHPYYGNGTGVKHFTAASSAAAHLLKTITTATTATTSTPQAAHTNRQHAQQQYQQQINLQQQHRLSSQHHNNATVAGVVPVHALNQNSNFSAASSSTGGGTNSSHAPTQQSNTTGSSLSPPATLSANPRTQTHASQHQQHVHHSHQQQQHLQNQVNKAISSNTAIATITSANNNTIIPPPRYTIVNSASPAALMSAGAGSIAASCKKIKTEPILSEMYKSERLSFANSHLTWSEENWRRLLLHDERKFNLDGPDGYSSYYHDLRNNERLLSQRPRGNSVYIHLLVTAVGPIHIEVATTKISADCVIETLLRQRTNIVTKLGPNGDFLLQDHNWTANALPAVQELLNAEGIKTQKWPTIAHDLDIMENIWGWIIREVYDGGRKFSRKDDLIFRIREAWARLPMELIRNLYHTMPERISELYQTLGNYTNC